MNRISALALTGLAAFALAAVPARAGEHRIGIGYHYFETVDRIHSPSGVDDKGHSVVFSYQYLPGGLLRFEGDLERYADGYSGSTTTAWAPQAYVLLGRGVYGGVGVGITKSDFANGDTWSSPWYAAKVGLDLLLLPKIHLDINANYRNNAFNELGHASTDAVTLGASLRLAF
jgi:hypothetical protein